ncbi:MAG: hypothetical protein D6681_04490, partial [Calditrichaeota bacterium]
KRWIYILLLFACLLPTLLAAQEHDRSRVEQELRHIKSLLDRTTALVNLLPDFANPEILIQIRQKLNEARHKFDQAVQLAREGHYNTPQFKVLIGQITGLLRQIEVLVQKHPVFRFKFQELLDRKIQRAEEAFRNAGGHNREALFLLNRARFYRLRAFGLFREGRTYAAIEYYRLAIHFADQVIHLLHPTDGDRDIRRWEEAYTDTRLLLERARALVEEHPRDAQLRNLLQRAESELREVERLVEQGSLSAARQKLTLVQRALYRLIDLTERLPEREIDRLRADLESLQFSLQTVEEKLTSAGSPAAKKLYRRAADLVRVIEGHIQRGQIRPARRKMFYANQLILKLYRLIEGEEASRPEILKRQLETAREDLEGLKRRPADWEGAQRFLEMIESNLDKAGEAINRQEWLQAAAHLRLANRLMVRYHRWLLKTELRTFSREQIATELQRLSQLLERLAEGPQADAEFRLRYQNATRLYELAQEAYQAGELEICRELTRLAIKLITGE